MAKQPILTHSAPTGSNMGVYSVAGIDQATGRYCGAGIFHSRGGSTSDAWDPDASGPAPSIPFVNSTSNANTAGDGRVWINADEAAGGVISSFQLDNVEGSFVPASYTGPAGGSFGGALEETTTGVIADTDLTLAGVAGSSAWARCSTPGWIWLACKAT